RACSFPTLPLHDLLRSGTISHFAASVYSVNMTVIGLAFIAMWTYLVRVPTLLDPAVGADGARRARRSAAIGPVLYALSIPVAFVSAVACLIVYAALALYFAIVFPVVGGREVTDTA